MIEYLIVGSGFTASVICIHLIDTGINPKKITVIGPTKLGQGNAFNCPNDQYRLNVRSEIMWIYPEKKSEFTNWAKKEIIDNDALHSAGNFYKRSDFGRFIYSKLRKYLESGELCHKKAVIKKIHKNIVTIIIPRHIDRAQSIKLSCKKLGLNSQILSDGELIEPNKEIIIINS